MRGKAFLTGMAVLAIVLGLSFTGCDNDTTSGGNVLVIQNIPNSVFNSAGLNAQIGLFNVGTTMLQAQSLTGFVAGANLYNGDVIVVRGSGSVTVSVPLYRLNNTRWHGSGVYDVYVSLADYGGTIYFTSSVDFSQEITTVLFSIAHKVSP